MIRYYGIIGGTHLGFVSDEQRRKTIEFLKTLNLEFIVHCITQEVMVELKNIFKDKLIFAGVGFEFKLD